jgi:gamma-carbonic anhydrase
MRIHGVVQVNTVPPPGITGPNGRVAVSDPAKIYPGQHEQIWGIQVSVDFPGTVYGVTRDVPAGLRVAHREHNDRNCVSSASATRQCTCRR